MVSALICVHLRLKMDEIQDQTDEAPKSEIQNPESPEPQPLFTATVEATFWDDGTVTFKWETLA